MSHMVTPPPAVEKSRDSFTITTAILSLIALIAGVAIGAYTSHWTIPMALIAVSILGVLAVGMRIAGLRKNLTKANLEGKENPES